MSKRTHDRRSTSGSLPRPCSPLQSAVLDELRTITHGRTAVGIAHCVRRKPLAVAGALNGLKARGLVINYLRGDSRWPTRYWCLANVQTEAQP